MENFSEQENALNLLLFNWLLTIMTVNMHHRKSMQYTSVFSSAVLEQCVIRIHTI